MKHRGPSSSRQPAREQARAHARARTPRALGAHAAGAESDTGGSGWGLRMNTAGQLVAQHRDGTQYVIATRDDEEGGENNR